MKKWPLLVLCCCFLPSCSPSTKLTKEIKKSLNVQNVFLPANSNFGPGNIFYRKDKVYQVACEPATTIKMSPDEVKANTKGSPITDMSVKKTASVSYDLKLSSSEKSVLKGAGVEAKYQNVTKLTLDYTNGQQYELFNAKGERVTFDDIISGIKKNEVQKQYYPNFT